MIVRKTYLILILYIDYTLSAYFTLSYGWGIIIGSTRDNMSNTMVTNADCGTGAGGFQPGNTCASGSGAIPNDTNFDAVSEVNKLRNKYEGIKDLPVVTIDVVETDFKVRAVGLAEPDSELYGTYEHGKGHIKISKNAPIEDQLTIGKETVGQDFSTRVRHEYGHHVQDHAGLPVDPTTGRKISWQNLSNKYVGKDKPTVVSDYAKTSHKELYAESFAAYTSPKYTRGALPKEIETYFDLLLTKDDSTKNTGSVYEAIKLVANFGKLRFVDINGRQFAIAPIKILMPRVLNGSKGALFYPPEEIARNIESWNGKPLVVKHPNLKGSNVSAHLPEIFATQEIGRIYNATIANDNSLTVDGYFDVDITRKLDNRVWNALIHGQKIEVSTGLFTDNEPAQLNSVYEGTPYTHIARNYRPDHLAILPDEVGACSCEDGCGVFQTYNKDERLVLANWLVANLKSPTNNPSWVADESIWLKAKEQATKDGHTDDYEYIVGIYKSMGGKVNSDTSTSNTGEPMKDRNWIINFMVHNCDCYKGNPAVSKAKLDALTDNELKEIILESKDSIITNAAKDEDSGDGKFFEWMMNADTDIRTAFVKMMKHKMISQTQVGGTGVKPPTNTGTGTTAPVVPPVETEEEKKKREEEEAKKKAAAQPAANTMTLSKEDQEALTEARKIVGNEKTRLVNILTNHITDNTKKTAAIATLNTKSLDDLRERVDLLPAGQTNNQSQAITGGNIPLPDFFGMVGAGNPTYNKSEVENDILDIPSHTY